jgi:hypothetical protein
MTGILFFISLQGLVPPWWITDGNKTWPKSLWIGIKFSDIHNELAKAEQSVKETIAKMQNASFDKENIIFFAKPRIELWTGTADNADQIRKALHIFERLSFNTTHRKIYTDQLRISNGIIELRIKLEYLPEMQALTQAIHLRLDDLNASKKSNELVLQIGHIKEYYGKKSLRLKIIKPIDIFLSISQIEYAVFPLFNKTSDQKWTPEQQDKAMYHSATRYARGIVAPSRPKNLLPGQSWIAPNMNILEGSKAMREQDNVLPCPRIK